MTGTRVHPSPRPLPRLGPGTFEQALVLLLPVLGALSQNSGDAFFRSDQAVLAAFGTEPVLQGQFSAWLAQAFLAVPLGNHLFRLALPGVFMTGLGGLACLHICHLLFRRQRGYSSLDRFIAVGAALSATFSLSFMSEATVVGGATVGAGLTLLTLWGLLREGLPRTFPRGLLYGLLFGLVIAESAWCAAVVFFGALAVLPEARPTFSRKGWLGSFAEGRAPSLLGITLGAASVVALLCASALGSHSLATLELFSRQSRASFAAYGLFEWTSSVGILWCVAALVGTAVGLVDRRPLVPFLLLIVADVLAPADPSSGWVTAETVDSSRLALHLVALAAVAPLGALGLRTAGEAAQALRLFGAGPLSKMAAVIAVAGCLASAEDALRTLSSTSTLGAQAWTDEALQSLPPDALILTTSPAVGRRLLAAQANGERPDVLVVPLSEVTRPGSIAGWLKKEPALSTLLRDLSISETPSERAITHLADARPVYLEPNPDWDQRLLEHVLPTAPLATFSSHALGRSDRMAALETFSAPLVRIESQRTARLTPDEVTARVVKDSNEELLAILERVKDGPAQEALKGALTGSKPSQPEGSLSPLAALQN